MRASWIYLLMLVAGVASGAEIYRSVDADGNVIYSDRPAGDDAETIFIDTATATPAPSAASGPVPDEDQGQMSADVTDSETAPDSGPTAEELAAQREENCAIARDRNERYMIAHRVYRGDEENREYLTDDELTAIRAESAADVEEWCG
ncbi:MAG: DUF4124 domain-containing protein [Candidatus Rariloculaceae bacterium]